MRKKLLILTGLAAVASSVLFGLGQSVAPCSHEWVSGPYYLTAAVTWEEPEYYPPIGKVPVQHCVICGALRLKPEFRSRRGGYLQQGLERAAWCTNISGQFLTNMLKAGDGLAITNMGSNVLILVPTK